MAELTLPEEGTAEPPLAGRQKRYRRGAASVMLWYAIQTYTGREEKLAEMIRRMVPPECVGECFVPYFEQLHCWHQQNQIRVLRLFPGYIFLSSDDIGGLFQWLKMVPAMSKIMTAGAFEFAPMDDGEAEFLLRMMDPDRIVRLTYVATDGKDRVSYLSGPLEKCRDHIQSYQFRKRFAQVQLRIAGQEKTARVGIILNDDVRREMTYGKVEAPVRMPERYKTPVLKKRTSGLEPGDRVAVVEGTFEGNVAVIRRVKSGDVQIAVHMFGRDILVEVPAESVRKLA